MSVTQVNVFCAGTLLRSVDVAEVVLDADEGARDGARVVLVASHTGTLDTFRIGAAVEVKNVGGQTIFRGNVFADELTYLGAATGLLLRAIAPSVTRRTSNGARRQPITIPNAFVKRLAYRLNSRDGILAHLEITLELFPGMADPFGLSYKVGQDIDLRLPDRPQAGDVAGYIRSVHRKYASGSPGQVTLEISAVTSLR